MHYTAESRVIKKKSYTERNHELSKLIAWKRKSLKKERYEEGRKQLMMEYINTLRERIKGETKTKMNLFPL